MVCLDAQEPTGVLARLRGHGRFGAIAQLPVYATG